MASRTIYTDSTLTDEKYDMIPKTYDVNEYTNINISDEDMARIYLNDYISRTVNDISGSYYLLDEEYRNLRFGNVESYMEYINSLNHSYHNVVSYYKKEVGEYTIYGVTDEDGNFFAFKTKGVMQYVVYLDEDTIEIW